MNLSSTTVDASEVSASEIVSWLLFTALIGVVIFLLFWGIGEDYSRKRRAAKNERLAILELGGTRKEAKTVYKAMLRGASAQEGWQQIERVR